MPIMKHEDMAGPKPRRRVAMGRRCLGGSVPYDAQPGDLVVGNRGAASLVYEWISPHTCQRFLVSVYAGNYGDGVRPKPGCKLYDLSGGTLHFHSCSEQGSFA